MLRIAVSPLSRLTRRFSRLNVAPCQRLLQPKALYRHLRTSAATSHEQPPEKTSPTPRTGEFNERLLEFLVCPLSKAPLRYDKPNQELICDELKVAYPIVNGVPNLIPHCGRKLDE